MDDDRRDLHLPGQQDVFPGLGHWSVGGGYHEYRAVHLRGAGDHVFDVVGVARAVDVGVVAVLGFVLDVGDRDGNAAGPFLRRVVDAAEVAEVGVAFLGENLGDGGGQGGFAVVDMADGADVDVGLGTVEGLFCHQCL